MINFIRNLANAVGDDKKSEDSSSTSTSRVIIRKIEDIPSVHYSDKITEIILNESLYKASIFLNGDFSVDYVDDKSYTCSYVLYFQDKKNETYKMAAKSKLLDITRLSAEARKDLETHKSIKFEIPDPPEETRKNYKLAKR